MSAQQFSTFAPSDAKGGQVLSPQNVAVIAIEFQNEFAAANGKLYPAVSGVMASTDMLRKAVEVCERVRAAGGSVIHAPITFKPDASDNPNKGLGILAGCAKDSLFTENTWASEFVESMRPVAGDKIVAGKKGLDAFPNTNLEELLREVGAETVVLMGFLTNCCVESTMRTACEKGFNVITITDGCATTSPEGQKGATEGTFGMFSLPMTAEDFCAKLPAAKAA